jgi:bacteriorhodopsin
MKANKALSWFVLVGWAIYPVGYILGTKGGLFGYDFGVDAAFMDVIYNVGDAINKIGFGLVIYALAVSDKGETTTYTRTQNGVHSETAREQVEA